MTIELTKGPTLYDHKLVDRLETYSTPLRDLQERDMEDAAHYLANRLHEMEEFEMDHETARHHVGRLHQRADY